MKYLVVRCEDVAPGAERLAPLLEGAKLTHLHELAQAGAGGLCRLQQRSPAGWTDRFFLHQALLGLAPGDATPPAGRCYAESAQMPVEAGQTAWCCDLITQRDGIVVDPTAGHVTTKESALLIEAIQGVLGSDVRRWQVGDGSHHLLLASGHDLDRESGRGLPATELLVGDAWEPHVPRGVAGAALRAVLEEASGILDRHPVNRVRVDLGENPANGIWLWGPGTGGMQRTFVDRTGLSGAVISSNFLVRGLAKALNLAWYTGPTSWEERSLDATTRSVTKLLPGCDFIYVHLVVASTDPVERLCAMERLDQGLLKTCTDALPRQGPWRLLVAVDDRTQGVVPFIAAGTDVPRHPAVSLERAAFAGSPLSFVDGTGWFAWLTTAS